MPLATVDLKSTGTHNAHWTDWSKARLKRLWSFSKAWVLSAQTSPALFFPESTIPFLPGPEIIKYLIPYKSAFLCLHCSYIPINWGFFKGRIAYFYTSTTSQRLAHRKCTTTFTDEWMNEWMDGWMDEFIASPLTILSKTQQTTSTASLLWTHCDHSSHSHRDRAQQKYSLERDLENSQSLTSKNENSTFSRNCWTIILCIKNSLEFKSVYILK